MPSIDNPTSVSPSRRRNARRSTAKSNTTSYYASEADEKPRDPAKSSRRTQRRQTEQDSQSTHHDAVAYLQVVWQNLLAPIIKLAVGVLSLVFTIIKPILTIILAFWLLAYVAQYVLHSTLSKSLSPVCNIPGVSQFIPLCATVTPSGPIEFDQLMTVQSSFDDVLAASAGNQNLPLDMKRSEASIRDLRQVVQYSALPSRNELVFELSGFIETARQAATDLTKFNSRIGRAVDRVMSTNKWTLGVIENMADKEASQGAIERFLATTIFSPFQSRQWNEDLLLDQYLAHTRTVEEQIQELILEAQALLGILQNLDDRLEVIHGITTRDGMSVKGSREDLFLELWTWLGGNRSSVKKHDDQLKLLGQLTIYRRTAWDHVSGTMLKLQAIAADLEDLRERVAAPDILRTRRDIPLRMHIEHIQLGLDRLEAQRSNARQVEGQTQRKVLDSARDELAKEQALLLT